MELRDQVQAALRDPDYRAAWEAVADVEGWMTEEQGAALWAAARSLPAGACVVEIGSYRGRSTSILARAATEGVTVVAIDPHAGNDRGPQQWTGTADEGQSDHEVFLANLHTTGVRDRVRHVRAFSQDAHDQVDAPVDLLYVDGAHGYGPAEDDLRRWGARVADDGTMLVHDCYSSIGVTLALLRRMVPDAGWTYLGRTGSLAGWRRTPASGVERIASVAGQLRPLGWFARNVVVKAAIVTRARPVARALGSDGETWPY